MKTIYLSLIFILLSTVNLSAQNSKPYTQGPKSVQTVPGQAVRISVNTDDDDILDTVRLTWSSGVPAATFTSNSGMVKHASGEISWTPGDGDTSRIPYPFYIIMDDGHEQVMDTFFIRVNGLPERLFYSKNYGNCGYHSK